VFEFTETIVIEAPPPEVWEVVRDIETWWLPSNPEHESLERLDNRGIEVGARIRIREKVAGVPGEAVGEITDVIPGSLVTWEAPQARYRWFGVPFTIGEGVSWRIEPEGRHATRVSAHVWARFPPGLRGRLLEWTFARLFRGIDKDRQHARTELEYLKRTIEAAGRPT
jgi:uncharacterized protein YndB with AHSA1/START domain